MKEETTPKVKLSEKLECIREVMENNNTIPFTEIIHMDQCIGKAKQLEEQLEGEILSVVHFKIGGVETNNVPANSDFTTDAFEFVGTKDFTWSITFEDLGIVGGSPVFDVWVSNNARFWYKWDLSTTNVNVKEDSAGSDHLGYRFMRIEYRAGGVAAGNVNLELGIFTK